MNVTVHVLTWNEEYLLPYFLRHYDFAENIIIHDNDSTDNTVCIAQSDPRVVVSPYHMSGDDAGTMTSLKNNCWRQDNTKWSIVCDIDEFLFIKPELVESWADRQVAFQSFGWQMIGSGEPLEEIAKGLRLECMDKTFLFTPSIDTMNYATGCHTASPTYQVIRATEMRHYQMLSEDYYLARCRRTAARLTKYARRRGWGRHCTVTESWIRKRYRAMRRRSISVPSLQQLRERRAHTVP